MKSSPVYFYVQKTMPQTVVGRVPFELTRLNVGRAMDASSGIFTAPVDGIYSFYISGVAKPLSASSHYLRIALMLNDNQIGLGGSDNPNDGSAHTYSLQSTLELKAGDQVWMTVHALTSGARLFDDWDHYTHFSGHLLQEHMTRSLNYN